MFERQKVIDIILAEVGYFEKKDGNLTYLYDKTANAGSSNYTKYGKEMHDLYPETMDYPAYWCDSTVDWCFQKAYGVSNAKGLLGGKFDDYTVNSAQLYKNKNAYYKSNPQIGDQIFFNNGKRICHTGLVYKVENCKVYTAEGNTSSKNGVVANGGCVALKSYSLNYARIDGYGRPNYSDKEEIKEVSNPYTKPTVTLRKGSKGDQVKWLQFELNKHGYKLIVDGDYGNATVTAVKSWQKSKGITSDGIAGKITINTF